MRATELLSEPIRVLLDAVAALDRARVDYLLGGSLASSVLGEPRATQDIDLALRLDSNQLEDLVRSLEPAFFVDPELAQEALDRSTSFNVLHRGTMLKVDLFILGDSAFDREQLRRRISVSISTDPEARVSISSAEDLVLRKLLWYRAGGGVSDRQWSDVLGILEVQRGRIDLEYLRRWGESLGVRELCERALAESGSHT